MTADVFVFRVQVPESLDLTAYRATSLQPGEVPMPEDAPVSTTSAATPVAQVESNKVTPDETIVAQLLSMGFSENGSRRAVIATHNSDPETAMAWVFEHMDDANFNEPILDEDQTAVTITSVSSTEPAVPAHAAEAVDMIASMGYTADQASAALKSCDYNLERQVNNTKL